MGPWLLVQLPTPVPWSGLQVARDTQLNPHRLKIGREFDILILQAQSHPGVLGSGLSSSLQLCHQNSFTSLPARSSPTSAWDTRSPAHGPGISKRVAGGGPGQGLRKEPAAGSSNGDGRRPRPLESSSPLPGPRGPGAPASRSGPELPGQSPPCALVTRALDPSTSSP